MVFESISKGLTSLTESTKNVASSTVKSAKSAGNTMLSPFETVGKTVKKYVPYIGSDEKIDNELTEVHLKNRADILIKKQIQSIILQCKKEKIPATKLANLKKGINAIQNIAENEKTYDQVFSVFFEELAAYKETLSTFISTEKDKKNEWIYTGKKTTLTSLQQTAVEKIIDQSTTELHTIQKKNKELIDPLLLPFSSKIIMNEEFEGLRKRVHSLQDELISSKFEKASNQKKVLYLMHQLEKLYKKKDAHSNNLIISQIHDLKETKIPFQHAQIDQHTTQINKMEDEIESIYENFYKKVQTRTTEYSDRSEKNKNQSSKEIIKRDKSNETKRKKITVQKKKLENAVKKVVSGCKVPYTEAGKVSHTIDAETKELNTYHMIEIEFLLTIWEKHLYVLKDLVADEKIQESRKALTYDLIGIQKERNLQLGLINRVNKKLSTNATKIRDLHVHLEKFYKEKALKLGEWSKNQVEIEKEMVISYDKRKREQEKAVDEKYVNINELKAEEKVLSKKKELQSIKREHEILCNQTKTITNTKDILEKEIKDLKNKESEIIKAIKREEIQVEDKKKSLKVTDSKSTANEIISREKKISEQELTLDLLKHHLDHEKELLIEIKETISENKKKEQKYKKKIDSLSEKLKKSKPTSRKNMKKKKKVTKKK